MSIIKPIVSSWDVFDTLVTRFLPNPKQVWQIMAQSYPDLNFAQRRMEAQLALDKLGKPYFLLDIYHVLVELGLTPEMAMTLYAEELKIEFSLLFPIKSAVERVAPGDLLITDMYIPGEIIEGWLSEICGLYGQLPIVQSNWGKHTGSIWPRLLKHYVIRGHSGDNPQSDFAIPGKFHISCNLVTDYKLTPWEQQLLECGGDQLALIQREARLRSLGYGASLYEQIAAGPYVSLLFSYAGFLAQTYENISTFGFLSRDCDGLSRIFRFLFPTKSAFNINLSRFLINQVENHKIFNAMLPEGSVLVDVVSTGRSVERLLSSLGRQNLFLTSFLFLDHLMESKAEPSNSMEFVFRSTDFGNNHYPLEILLQSAYPPVRALEPDPASGGLVRAFGAPEYTPSESRMILAKNEIVTKFLNVMRSRGAPLLSKEQNLMIMKMSLNRILNSGLRPEIFPSFCAREQFL